MKNRIIKTKKPIAKLIGDEALGIISEYVDIR